MVTVIYLVAAYELYERSHKNHVRGPERMLPKDKRMPHLTPENQFPSNFRRTGCQKNGSMGNERKILTHQPLDLF